MIALIGYMGAGKSTVATKLSKKLVQPMYETDQIVYELVGVNNMQAVFDRGGEELLRASELQAIQSLKDKLTGIIDCGGGLVTYDPSREALQSISRKIVFLNIPFEIAMERVSNDENRPLLKDKEAAHTRFQQRQAIYEAVATDIVEVHDQTTDEVVAQVEEVIS